MSSYTSIIMLAYDLHDEFKSLDIYKEYEELKEKSSSYSYLLDNFNTAKEKFDNLVGGKYNPSFKDYALKLQEAKKAMFDNDILNRLFKVETILQNMLDDISRQIASVISSRIKVPNEFGVVNFCNH